MQAAACAILVRLNIACRLWLLFMSLPASDHKREHLHTRTLRIDGYARDDGQWDLDAELIDVKAYDFPKREGIHRAGEPVHKMQLRVTFNKEFTITDAVAAYDAAPYKQHCFSIAPDYHDLVGLNLLRGFRHAVKQRFGKTAGCTHMSELSQVLPTAAVQTLAGRPRKPEEQYTDDETAVSRAGSEDKQPFHLEGCHALRLDGEMVKKFYPRWYIAPENPDRS